MIRMNKGFFVAGVLNTLVMGISHVLAENFPIAVKDMETYNAVCQRVKLAQSVDKNSIDPSSVRTFLKFLDSSLLSKKARAFFKKLDSKTDESLIRRWALIRIGYPLEAILRLTPEDQEEAFDIIKNGTIVYMDDGLDTELCTARALLAKADIVPSNDEDACYIGTLLRLGIDPNVIRNLTPEERESAYIIAKRGAELIEILEEKATQFRHCPFSLSFIRRGSQDLKRYATFPFAIFRDFISTGYLDTFFFHSMACHPAPFFHEIFEGIKSGDCFLTALFISSTRVDDSDALSLAEALKSNNTLTKLSLEDDSITSSGVASLAEALKINSSLINFDLSRNQIEDSGVQSLAEALKINSSLIILSLNECNILDSGAPFIGEALKLNSSLEQLYMFGNHIRNSGVKSLSEGLKVNSCLARLDLGFCGVEDAVIPHIKDFLIVNESLTHLSLAYCCVDDFGASSLAEALKTNSILINLNLGKNHIGHSGASSLAEALKVNSRLMKLDLEENRIGDSGASSLAEGLKVNSGLIKLDLEKNGITSSGASSLADALKINSTLIELYLNGNEIDDSGAQSIGDALKINSSLTNLCILVSGNFRIGKPGKKAIADGLESNCTITKMW